MGSHGIEGATKLAVVRLGPRSLWELEELHRPPCAILHIDQHLSLWRLCSQREQWLCLSSRLMTVEEGGSGALRTGGHASGVPQEPLTLRAQHEPSGGGRSQEGPSGDEPGQFPNLTPTLSLNGSRYGARPRGKPWDRGSSQTGCSPLGNPERFGGVYYPACGHDQWILYPGG